MNTDIFDPIDSITKNFNFIQFKGEDGRPAKRTKYTNPYNYDPFVLFDKGFNYNELQKDKDKSFSSCYSDRLFQWDSQKYNLCHEKHFGNRGQNWERGTEEKTQNFLRDYFDVSDLILTRIVEYCNASTGYPCWRFDYFYKKEEAKNEKSIKKKNLYPKNPKPNKKTKKP